MTVLDNVPGLEVTVQVNGSSLQEYNDDDSEPAPKTVTKYIEAISGAQFRVRYEFKESFRTKNGILTDIYIDGKDVAGYVLKANQLHGAYVMSGKRERGGNEYFQRPFTFSQLSIDDTELSSATNALLKDLKNIGQISVRFHRISVGASQLPPISKFGGLYELGTVPEKALKGRALSHQAGFGERQTIKPFENFGVTYLDGWDRPFATYNFLYRSKESLRALMIVQRTPSPAPLEHRDPEDLTPEERLVLLRQYREREKAARRTEQEGVKKELKVKREGVKRGRSRSRSVTAVGEDDDDDAVTFVSAKRLKVPVIRNEDGVEVLDLT